MLSMALPSTAVAVRERRCQYQEASHREDYVRSLSAILPKYNVSATLIELLL